MARILKKKILNANTVQMTLETPAIAARALPGQFVILTANETAERIPLTIAHADPAQGSIQIIFQAVGKSTLLLAELEEGDEVAHVTGPLGTASELNGYKKVAVIGGGLGCAIAYPQAEYLFRHGASVDLIAGFRSKDLVIIEDEMRAACTNFILMTDDGSAGGKGFVTTALKERMDAGEQYDLVIAIGPAVMMRSVCNLTKEYGVKTVVSLNPIMIDGTGMCGGCRVKVGGQMKFACVDGPDFDGHEVDFDELILRNRMYAKEEKASMEGHSCNLLKKADRKEANA